MKLFIIFNLLLAAIILIRFIADGKITRKMQYRIWLILPVFVLLYSFVQIPFKVYVRQNVEDNYSYYTEQYEVPAKNVSEEGISDISKVETDDVAVDKVQEIDNKPIVIEENSESVSTINKAMILKIVYFSGVILVSSYIGINNALFIRRIRKNREFYCQSSFGKLNVYKLRDIKSPFLFGRGIYIPQNMEKDTEEYKHAICHEYCHFSMGDNIWIIIKYLFMVVLWFDPLVWIALSMIGQDSEMAVDEKVISILGEENKVGYGTTLVSFVSRVSGINKMALATIPMSRSTKNFMKSRITHIVKGTKKSVAITIAVAIFIGCVISFSALSPYKVKAATYFKEDTPWNSIIEADSFVENKSGVYLTQPVLFNDDYFLIFARNDSSDDNNLLRYSYQGELETSINLNFSEFDAYNVVCGFSKDSKDYVVVEQKSYDDFTTVNRLYLCEVSYIGKQLVNRVEINLDNIFDGKYKTVDACLSGDDLILTVSGNTRGYAETLIIRCDLTGHIVSMRPINQCIPSDCFSIDSGIAKDGQYGDKVIYRVETEYGILYYEYNPQNSSFLDIEHKQGFQFGFLTIPDENIVIGKLKNQPNKIVKLDASSGNLKEEVMDMSYSSLSVLSHLSAELVGYSGGAVAIALDPEYDSTSNLQAGRILIINPLEKNPNVGKQIITAAVVGSWYDNNPAVKYIEKYNNENNKYFIKVSDKYHQYSINDFDSMCDVSQQLLDDINAGIGPDIVIGGANICSTNPGLIYQDLSDLVNNLDRRLYSDVVFEGNKTTNGIYSIPYAVNLNGLIVKPGSTYTSGFTYDEYVDFINRNHSGKDVINSSPYYGNTENIDIDLDYFRTLFECQGNNYVIDNSFSISNNENFKSTVDFVSDRENKFSDESSNSGSMVSHISVRKFIDYMRETSIKDRLFVGIPSPDGTGVYTDSLCSVQITKCASSKEGAIDFINNLLSYEFQYNVNDYIPVRLDALSDKCDITIESIIKNDWNEVAWEYNGKSDFDGCKASFISTVKNLKEINDTDPIIMKVVSEEIRNYYDGTKSYEKASKDIESRINKYLSERG